MEQDKPAIPEQHSACIYVYTYTWTQTTQGKCSDFTYNSMLKSGDLKVWKQVQKMSHAMYVYMSGSPCVYKAGWCARQVARIPCWWELISSKQRCTGIAGLSGPTVTRFFMYMYIRINVHVYMCTSRCLCHTVRTWAIDMIHILYTKRASSNG